MLVPPTTHKRELWKHALPTAKHANLRVAESGSLHAAMTWYKRSCRACCRGSLPPLCFAVGVAGSAPWAGSGMCAVASIGLSFVNGGSCSPSRV